MRDSRRRKKKKAPFISCTIKTKEIFEEALENIKDAIRLHIEDRIESGEEVPQADSVSLTLMEIAV